MTTLLWQILYGIGAYVSFLGFHFWIGSHDNEDSFPALPVTIGLAAIWFVIAPFAFVFYTAHRANQAGLRAYKKRLSQQEHD